MVKNRPKEKDLGKCLIRTRFPHRRVTKESETELQQIIKDEQINPNSITEMKDLDEFVYQAELSGADFKAERLQTKILSSAFVPGTVMSHEEQLRLLESFKEKRDRLRIPRRPQWNSQMSAEELDQLERSAFLTWRRELANLMELEGKHIEFTPFEKNLEIWRQLWRVIDRSNLLVQIVDARNPLLYYCEDLVTYCNEVNLDKKCVLLVNKADLISEKQRQVWADYFTSSGIQFVFYSALTQPEGNNDDQSTEVPSLATDKDDVQSLCSEGQTKIYTPSELVQYLIDSCPTAKLSPTQSASNFPLKCIGLVGYPNVGKSSTINSIFGTKKVAVAATPGKTKHFQTLWLQDDVLLCDCPGLVFPNFASSKAELVVNGILPIDQARDYVSPASLVAQRIPREFLESLYGIFISKPAEGMPEDTPPTGSELLSAFAIMRGFRTGVYGAPDESRAARIILKDYISGRLRYCHAPVGVDERQFNEDNFKTLVAERALCDKFQARLQFQQTRSAKEHGDSKKSFDNSFFAPPPMGIMVKGRKIGLQAYFANAPVGEDGKPLTVKDFPKKHFTSKRK